MIKLISDRREILIDKYIGTSEYWTLSPVTYNSSKILSVLIEKYCLGEVLDAGAGRGAWKVKIKALAKSYTSVDLSEKNNPDIVADLQDLSMIKDKSKNAIFCVQVFEYVESPDTAMSEFRRILDSEGILILSTPFLSQLHDEPYDLNRFSVDGLRKIAERNNFRIVESYKSGGLFAFIFHPISILLTSVFAAISPLSALFVFLNKFLLVYPVDFADKALSLDGKYFSNSIIVAKKISND